MNLDDRVERHVEHVFFEGEHSRTHCKWYRSDSPYAIILHHGIGEYLWTMRHHVKAFRSDYNVFNLSLPFHGKSTSITGEFNFFQMTETICDVWSQIRARGFEYVGALGTSFGSLLAGHAASKSDDIDALCLIATGSSFDDYYPRWVMWLGTLLAPPHDHDIFTNINKLFKLFSAGWTPQADIVYNPHEPSVRLGACKLPSLNTLARCVYEAPRLIDVASHISSRLPIKVVIGGDDQALGLYSKPAQGQTNLRLVVHNNQQYAVYVPLPLQKLWEKLHVDPDIFPTYDHSLNPLGTTRKDSCLMDIRNNPRVWEIYARIRLFFDTHSPMKNSGRLSGVHYVDYKHILPFNE